MYNSAVKLFIIFILGIGEVASAQNSETSRDCSTEYAESNKFDLYMYTKASGIHEAQTIEARLKEKAGSMIKRAQLKDTIYINSKLNINPAGQGDDKYDVLTIISYNTGAARDELVKFFNTIEPEGTKALLRSNKHVTSDTCVTTPFTDMQPLRPEEIPQFCKNLPKVYSMFIKVQEPLENYTALDSRLDNINHTFINELKKMEITAVNLHLSEVTVIPDGGVGGRYDAIIKQGYSIWGNEKLMADIAQYLSNAGLKAEYSIDDAMGMISVCPETWDHESG